MLPARAFWWDRARPIDADVYPLRAVIFDLDGLADIERDGHRVAFNKAFAMHDLDIDWDVEHYAHLLNIVDERRRIAADLRRRGFGTASTELAGRLHRTKTAVFEAGILDADVAPRDGLIDLVMSLYVAGIEVAVVSRGRRAWVEPLVRQLVGDGIVGTIVTGDDVDRPKQDSEFIALALWELGIAPGSALVVTGSARGRRAAGAAALATVVVTSNDAAGQDFTGAAAVRPTFDGADPLLAEDCRRLHRRWWIDNLRAA
jgi:beta-phosphoglucomutase-like phosphatase (HAD superfamily)